MRNLDVVTEGEIMERSSIGQADTLQRSACRKGKGLDVQWGEGVEGDGKLHFSQRPAHFEGIFLDEGERFGECDLFQQTAILEGILTNDPEVGGQMDLRQC